MHLLPHSIHYWTMAVNSSLAMVAMTPYSLFLKVSAVRVGPPSSNFTFGKMKCRRDKIRRKGRMWDQHDASRRRLPFRSLGSVERCVGPMQVPVLGQHIGPLLTESTVPVRRSLAVSVQTVIPQSSSTAAATDNAASAVPLVFLFAAV